MVNLRIATRKSRISLKIVNDFACADKRKHIQFKNILNYHEEKIFVMRFLINSPTIEQFEYGSHIQNTV